MIFEGLASRFQQTFNCPVAFINQTDKTAILQRIFGQGKQVTYPYAWMVLQSVNLATNTYNSHSMGRRGLTFSVPSEDRYQTVKVVPVNFEFEVFYTTNQFESVDQGSTVSFIRRWALARRFGYLKSTVKYGNLRFGINTTLAEQLTVPVRENITENETKYEMQAQLTVHGYISEPVVSQVGRIKKINLLEVMSVPGSSKTVSTKTFMFDPDQDQPATS